MQINSTDFIYSYFWKKKRIAVVIIKVQTQSVESELLLDPND